MRILGIHDGHNASAALIEDGEIIMAVQEERLNRIKNWFGFPSLSINHILSNQSLSIDDIDFFTINGYHMPPGWRKREEIIKNYKDTASLWVQVKWRLKRIKFVDKFYQWLSRRNRIKPYLDLGIPKEKMVYVEHHLAHAAASYYGMNKLDEKILVLTCDGAGDRICATVNIGYKGEIKRIAKVHEFDSIGSLCSKVTFYLGMMPLEHEYKVMGLAPYAYNSNNSERLKRKFSMLYNFDERYPLIWRRSRNVPAIYYSYGFLKDYLELERFDWIAAGLQKFLEDFLVRWVRNCIRSTGIRKIALGGGVFMNVKVNKLIMEFPEVEDIFIFPSCGDETNSIGSAYYLYAQKRLKEGKSIDIPNLGPIYWGKSFSADAIENILKEYKFDFPVEIKYFEDIEKKIAGLLSKKKIVARFNGRMEFGARALGNRSILANPQNLQVVRIINEMIKNRDFWMPFAPSVLEERAKDYYLKPKSVFAPYMMLCFDSKIEKLQKFIAAAQPWDFTVRPQEVSQNQNPDFWRLLKYFQELTGESIILNTSFNLHGSPIVYSPEDALYVFCNSGLKYLALENYMISKKD